MDRMNITESETDTAYSRFKILHHPERLEKLRKGELFPPSIIQLDLEAWCPHDCNFCAYRNAGFNERGMRFFDPSWAADVELEQTGSPKGKPVSGKSGFPKEVALDLPRQMHEAGIPAVEITGGGESLAYPHIIEFFEECAKYDIEIGLVTNGHLLTEKVRKSMKNVKWVRFSLDSCTEETHSKVHGVNKIAFATIVKNIQDFILEAEKDTIVGASFVITKENMHEIVQAAKFWKGMGLQNIRYTFMYDSNYDSGLNKMQLWEAKQALQEAKLVADNTFAVFAELERPDYYSNPNNDFTFCGHQLFKWAIGYNCIVYPCCIMKYYHGYEMGDLNMQTLKQIVFSDKRKQFMEKFDVKTCKPCWLRDKNKFIEYAVKSNPLHKNFV